MPEPELALAVKSNLAVMRCLETQIATITQSGDAARQIAAEFQRFTQR